VLVDISIDARHIDDSRRFPSAPTIERCAAGSRGARPCDGKRGSESTLNAESNKPSKYQAQTQSSQETWSNGIDEVRYYDDP
jgi:hypothetical protein